MLPKSLLALLPLIVVSCNASPTEPASSGLCTGDECVAVLTRVCGPDNCQHYLNAFARLPADQLIDRSKGIESGNTQGTVFRDAIYIFDRDDSSVTRWTVDATGALVAGGTVSFQGAGVKDACAICNVFGDERHAYMVGSSAGVMVTWNPTDMTLVATQDLPAAILSRDGIPAAFAWPFVQGGRAFMAASWINYDTLAVYGRAAVLAFDATADRPEVTVLEDERCGVSSTVTPFADAEGNVYVVGDWNAGLEQVGKKTKAPNPACLLRVRPGATSFDPDYYLDLLAATNAQALYGAYAMAGGKLLVNILPKEAPPTTGEAIDADSYAYFNRLDFTYAVLDLTTRATTPVALPPGGAGNNTPLVLDGVNYIQVYPQGQFTGEDPGADLYAVRADGSAVKALRAGAAGDFEMIGRLRGR